MGKVLVHSKEEAARIALDMGGCVHITVLHDDACTPSRCSCKPDYIVQTLTAESYEQGAKAEAIWRKATSS